MKLGGFSLIFWLIIIVFIVFGSYVGKTIYGSIYRTATGQDIGSSFYTNNKYGQPDRSYELAKGILRA